MSKKNVSFIAGMMDRAEAEAIKAKQVTLEPVTQEPVPMVTMTPIEPLQQSPVESMTETVLKNKSTVTLEPVPAAIQVPLEPTERKTKKAGFLLRPSLYERLREIAWQRRISMNDAAAEAFEEYCSKYEN